MNHHILGDGLLRIPERKKVLRSWPWAHAGSFFTKLWDSLRSWFFRDLIELRLIEYTIKYILRFHFLSKFQIQRRAESSCSRFLRFWVRRLRPAPACSRGRTNSWAKRSRTSHGAKWVKGKGPSSTKTDGFVWKCWVYYIYIYIPNEIAIFQNGIMIMKTIGYNGV